LHSGTNCTRSDTSDVTLCDDDRKCDHAGRPVAIPGGFRRHRDQRRSRTVAGTGRQPAETRSEQRESGWRAREGIVAAGSPTITGH
jgi:hypothetical protein